MFYVWKRSDGLVGCSVDRMPLDQNGDLVELLVKRAEWSSEVGDFIRAERAKSPYHNDTLVPGTWEVREDDHLILTVYTKADAIFWAETGHYFVTKIG